MKALPHRAVCVVLSVGALHASTAAADTLVIKRPGAHPAYLFEAEPHLSLGALPPPGQARGSGFGMGFRGTLELVDNGFISSINNTVGVGFGVDWMYYPDSHLDCERDPDSNSCVDLDPDFSVTYVYLPVVMQWNFWLSRAWSVFGEPGFSIRYASRGDKFGISPFVLFAGGRYHFTDRISLTMRVGYPTFHVGVSFLL